MSEGATMDKGGQSPEQLNQLKMFKLDTKTFSQYEEQIISLTHNVLNTREGAGLAAREDDVTGLREKYLESSQHGELHIAVRNGVVIAFVALKKSSDGGAVIEQIRVASGLHTPGAVLKDVLRGVESELQKEGIRKVSIQLEGKHTDLAGVKNDSWFGQFFTIKKEGAAAGSEGVA